MTGAYRRIAGPLGAILLGLAACSYGVDAPPETCFHLDIRYSGTQSGIAYGRLLGDESVWGIQSYATAPSIDILIAAYARGMYCGIRRVDPGDVPVVADAWIDVAGDEVAVCADVLSATCGPSPLDPQGRTEGTMRFGEVTTIVVEVVDPPR